MTLFPIQQGYLYLGRFDIEEFCMQWLSYGELCLQRIDELATVTICYRDILDDIVDTNYSAHLVVVL
jgi:hypothetical protein